MFSHRIAKGFRLFPARLPPPLMRGGPRHPPAYRSCGQHALIAHRQHYTTDKHTPEALENDLVKRINRLEKGYNIAVEDELRSMKEELAKEFTKNLERGLRATNDAISQFSSWFKWITAVFAIGMAAKFMVYDPRATDAVLAKITESETNVTTMVANTISQLKLQLVIDEQERLLADKDKGGE